jgi:hypothetical protein
MIIDNLAARTSVMLFFHNRSTCLPLACWLMNSVLLTYSNQELEAPVLSPRVTSNEEKVF